MMHILPDDVNPIKLNPQKPVAVFGEGRRGIAYPFLLSCSSSACESNFFLSKGYGIHLTSVQDISSWTLCFRLQGGKKRKGVLSERTMLPPVWVSHYKD